MASKHRLRLARCLQVLLIAVASLALLTEVYLTVPVFGFLGTTEQQHDAVTQTLHLLDYFTVQSNLAAIVFTLASLGIGVGIGVGRGGTTRPRWLPAAQLAVLAGLFVTAVIYQALLQTSGGVGGAAAAAVALHVAVPVLAFVAWLLLPPVETSVRDVGLAVIWPCLYAVSTLAYAAGSRWAPYPFLDPQRHGWGVVGLAVFGVLLLFVAAALVCRLVDLARGRHDRARRPDVSRAARASSSECSQN